MVVPCLVLIPDVRCVVLCLFSVDCAAINKCNVPQGWTRAASVPSPWADTDSPARGSPSAPSSVSTPPCRDLAFFRLFQSNLLKTTQHSLSLFFFFSRPSSCSCAASGRGSRLAKPSGSDFHR